MALREDHHHLLQYWGSGRSWTLLFSERSIALVLPLLILAVVGCLAYTHYFAARMDDSSNIKSSTDYHGMESGRPPGPTCQPIYRDSNRRAVFEGNACTVYSWPSFGGVVIKEEISAVELTFLGLDRLNPQPQRDPDPEAENAFSRELRKIGGKWWSSEKRSRDVFDVSGKGGPPTAEERIVQVFGWPQNGGLLVLERESEELMPEDIGRLMMAITMEERCRLLEERFHAKKYQDPREYEGLADVWRAREGQHQP